VAATTTDGGTGSSKRDKLFRHFFVGELGDPYTLYEHTRSYLTALCTEISQPLALLITTRDSRVILPVASVPEQYADHFRELIDMGTVFTTQRYRLGSKLNAGDEGGLWLFDVLTQSSSALRCQRRKQTKYKDKSRRKYPYACSKLGDAGSPTQECLLYTPRLPVPDDPGPYLRLYDDIAIQAIRYPSSRSGAEVYLFVATSGDISPHTLDDLCKELLGVGSRLVDVFRNETSSVNPRYISRYFQIKIGRDLLLDALRKNKPTEVEKKFISAFFQTTHDVSVRHLLRECHKDKQVWKNTVSLIKSMKSKDDDRRAIKDVQRYIEQIEKKEEPCQPHPEGRKPTPRSGYVVVAASPRGGVGKTTVLYSLASMFARKHKACYIELDLASPTIYYINRRYRWFLRKNASEYETDPMPEIFEEWAAGQQRSEDDLARLLKKFRYIDKDSSELHVYALSPKVPPVDGAPEAFGVGDLLARATSLGSHRRFMTGILGALRNRLHYDWIFVDTAAGMRDFTGAMTGMPEADVILMLCHATKLSLLSTLRNFMHGSDSSAARRLLVINEVRDIDELLFGNVDAVRDFVDHWSNDDGTGPLGPQTATIMMKNLRDSCRNVCPIPWNESWRRPEDVLDWFGFLPESKQMMDLLKAVESAAADRKE
jgi:cellulose biosynthesis protein BcsQ